MIYFSKNSSYGGALSDCPSEILPVFQEQSVRGELKPPMTSYKAIIFFRFFGLIIWYNKTTDFLKRTGFIQISCSYQAIVFKPEGNNHRQKILFSIILLLL